MSSPTPSSLSPGKTEVVDFRGIPLREVAVKLQLAPPAPLPHLIEETTITLTGPDGSFVSPYDAPKGSILVLEKKNYATMAFYPDKVPARIILPPAARLMGTVIDEKGTSIPGAVIGPVAPPLICDHGPADIAHPVCNPLRFETTNDRGFFRVDGLPIHKYEFHVLAPGFQPKVIQAVTGAPFTITLQSGGTTVTGQVLGTRDRLPQPGVYVQALAGSGLTRLYTATDTNGRFEFGNLSNQEWVLNVYSGADTSHHTAKAVQVPEETSVSLLLNQGSSVSGRVIEARTSAPLANIALTLMGSGGTKPQTARTGPDGTFAFAEVDALDLFTLRFDPLQYVRVLPDGETRDYMEVNPADGKDRDSIQLVLRKNAPVHGYVMDVTGTPVEVAEVMFTSASEPEKAIGKEGVQVVRPLEYNTISNNTGQFKIGLYPPGRYKVQARKDNLISEAVFVDAYTTTPAPAIQLRVTPSKPLVGRVVDHAENPVLGSLVAVMRNPDMTDDALKDYELGHYKTTRTNPDGEFRFEGLLSGESVHLKATHPEFAQAATGTFAAGTETTDSIVLRFPAGGEIQVVVTDNAAKPIPGAEVVAHYTVDMQGATRSRRTDRDGIANLRGFPVKQIERLEVRHQGYADVQITEPIPLPQPSFLVTLSRKGTINVTVQGSLSGTNAEEGDFAVTLLHVSSSAPGASADSSAPDDAAFTEHSRAKPVEGQATFPGLNPGWYKAAVLAGSNFAETDPVRLQGDAPTVDLVLQVKAGPPLSGRITDKSTGQGIQGASISIKPAAQFFSSETINPMLAYSNATGDFTIADTPAGALQVRVVAVGYPEHEETVAASARGNRMQIVLSNEPGGVQGTVTQNNRPVADALLILSNPSATEDPVASALSDANGAFSLTGFPVGQYVLSVEAPVGEGDEVSRRSESVNVANSNTRHDIVIPLQVNASGRATLGGKAPKYPDGSTPRLMFMPQGGGGESKHVQLNDDGTFSVQIDPGVYSVGIEDRPGVEVEIPPTGTQNLQLNY